MPVSISIRGQQLSPKLEQEGRIGLEESIEDFLEGDGQVGDGGGGSMGWDIQVTDVEEDGLDGWLERLSEFLREWGAPADTALHVFTEDDEAEDDEAEDGEVEDGEPTAPSPHRGRVVRVFPEAH